MCLYHHLKYIFLRLYVFSLLLVWVIDSLFIFQNMFYLACVPSYQFFWWNWSVMLCIYGIRVFLDSAWAWKYHHCCTCLVYPCVSVYISKVNISYLVTFLWFFMVLCNSRIITRHCLSILQKNCLAPPHPSISSKLQDDIDSLYHK